MGLILTELVLPVYKFAILPAVKNNLTDSNEILISVELL